MLLKFIIPVVSIFCICNLHSNDMHSFVFLFAMYASPFFIPLSIIFYMPLYLLYSAVFSSYNFILFCNLMELSVRN